LILRMESNGVSLVPITVRTLANGKWSAPHSYLSE
jgi:hypothetical protein